MKRLNYMHVNLRLDEHLKSSWTLLFPLSTPSVSLYVDCSCCCSDCSDSVLFVTAMTTSKWDILEAESDGEKDNGMKGADEDIDGAWVLAKDSVRSVGWGYWPSASFSKS